MTRWKDSLGHVLAPIPSDTCQQGTIARVVDLPSRASLRLDYPCSITRNQTHKPQHLVARVCELVLLHWGQEHPVARLQRDLSPPAVHLPLPGENQDLVLPIVGVPGPGGPFHVAVINRMCDWSYRPLVLTGRVQPCLGQHL
jgi:hypothetical protein